MNAAPVRRRFPGLVCRVGRSGFTRLGVLSMNKFTIRQLEYLVAVGQFGSITEAAHHLLVSQPAITSAIAQLEGVFGQQLFHRHRGTGVSPTAAGQRALIEARNILTLVDDFPSALSAEDEEISGTVSVGCFEPLACYQLPALLGALASKIPKILIEFSLQTQSRIHEGLQTGEFELGFSYDSGFWEDLKKVVLYYVTPYALLPANHRLAAKKKVSLHDLVQEPFVLVDLPRADRLEHRWPVYGAYGDRDGFRIAQRRRPVVGDGELHVREVPGFVEARRPTEGLGERVETGARGQVGRAEAKRVPVGI